MFSILSGLCKILKQRSSPYVNKTITFIIAHTKYGSRHDMWGCNSSACVKNHPSTLQWISEQIFATCGLRRIWVYACSTHLLWKCVPCQIKTAFIWAWFRSLKCHCLEHLFLPPSRPPPRWVCTDVLFSYAYNSVIIHRGIGRRHENEWNTRERMNADIAVRMNL